MAYLAPYYPALSHTFIQREILGLEARGVQVLRFSTRPNPSGASQLCSESELKQTEVLLDAGVSGLGAALTWAAVTRPTRFLAALRLAIAGGRRSDRGVVAHIAYLAEASLLLQRVARAHVDHVHAHFAANTASIAMLCRMMGGPPYSFTAHGPDDFDRARLLGLQDKIARARFVFSVSSYGRSQLLRWCRPSQWAKVHVIPPGIDSTFLIPPIPVPATPRLVCVGRLHEQKGQLLLVEAVLQLRAEGLTCEVILVGEGPMRMEIERRIAEFKLQERVTLTGPVSTAEIVARIQSARTVVLPSFAENFPSVILEAFAMNRPVIATYVGGIPEIVKNGVNGWLVPAGEVSSLVAAMREALSAPVSRLEEMGRAGSRLVRAEYRSDVIADRLLEMFQRADHD